MLDAHPQIVAASDPFLPLLRAARNRIAQNGLALGESFTFDAGAPIQDYYFTDDRIRMMDCIQAGTLELPVEPGALESLREECRGRAAAECADMVPHVSSLSGHSFRELVESGLGLIANARGAENAAWVGFKEVWVIEMLRPLARAFPSARFIVLVRDPRAVLASIEALGRVDAAQVGHPLSYARHWRKYAAFLAHYQADAVIRDRIMTLTYESMVSAPRDAAERVCGFLGVDFHASMLDAQNYIDYATGRPWKRNSSFQRVGSRITSDTVQRWRGELPLGARRMTHLVCGPDMRLMGYAEPGDLEENAWRGGGDVLEYLDRTNARACAWRTDLGDAPLDYELEVLRQSMLDPRADWPEALVRRAFLFRDAFEAVKEVNVGGRAALGFA